MPLVIDTPLLVVGCGPAALVVAKVASGFGLASVVAGHEPLGSADGRPTGDDSGGNDSTGDDSTRNDSTRDDSTRDDSTRDDSTGAASDAPVELGVDAVAVLTPHGVLDVLRPYLASAEPPAIAPSLFEEVLKHHCVADMNVTVYDGLRLVERERRGAGVVGVLSDGRSRWEVRADAFVDASELPHELPSAITAGADRARAVLATLTA